MVSKPKYITNKDLLREIHESKKSFCSFKDPAHADYDAIVHSLDEITDDLIEAVLLKKRTARTKIACSKRTPEELVFRLMTYEHIPIDPERKRRAKNGISYAKTTFEPFKHVMIKDGGFVEVCRSHWIGDFETGRFSADHGRISNALATMYMLLVERYSRRGNWRGYCVDETTQALTKRGWLRQEEITTDDMILSYKDGSMVWSKIKSIFRDHYDGLMFHLTVTGMDALVTPEHKFVTTGGLVKVDHLREKDRLIMLGDALADEGREEHDDAFVEEIGRKMIQTGTPPGMDFLLSLSTRQRVTLLDVIAHESPSGTSAPITEAMTDLLTALATFVGARTRVRSDGTVHLLPVPREAEVAAIDFHGGRSDVTNTPTVPYKGIVWCPETEFGSFVARRNGTIFLTGNSYVDEMRSHALLQLSQIGLQFDESKSENPFAFYTTAIKNCLSGETEIITREYGVIPIAQVANQDVTLRDGNGDWVKCHIHDYGVKTTVKTRFTSGGFAVDIWSTPDHGWVLADGQGKIPTLGFKGRDTEIQDLSYPKIVHDDDEYRLGIVHGVVYGDGSLSYHREDGARYQIRLCGDKAELLPLITETVPDVNVTYPPSSDGDPSCHFDGWCDLKAFPERPGDSLDYLLGFLRGWQATDGCVSKDNGTVTLCGGPAEHEWLKTWGPLVGWYVNGCTTLAETTNFGTRKKDPRNFHMRKGGMVTSDFLRSKHRENWVRRPVSKKGNEQGKKYDWALVEKMRAEGKAMQEIADHLGVKRTSLSTGYCQFKKVRAAAEANPDRRVWMVYGSRQDPSAIREERVYCPVVNTTHSFVLGCGATSRNCCTRVLNLEKRHQKIRDDLLIFAGATPSFTRQIDNEMETRMLSHDADKVTTAPKKAGRKAKSPT